jgi:hypothetical protein
LVKALNEAVQSMAAVYRALQPSVSAAIFRCNLERLVEGILNDPGLDTAVKQRLIGLVRRTMLPESFMSALAVNVQL